ncbi:MAG TPA: NAD(P)H-binding protein, partial [Syntrophorhabdales bacterium]|nr:NAD(P)H-binding protein [Syntrophorhabdales bacterium]
MGGASMITILGATGNVGGKIAAILAKKNEPIRVISRSADRLRRLASKTVTAFVGDVRETEFLVKAFTDVDAVFVLIPPNPTAPEFMRYADTIGQSIARALKIAKVKHVVFLSSIGAELADEATGPIKGLHNMEELLNRIKGLHVRHMRAGYFMENLLWNIELIRSKGITGSAVRGDVKLAMIATKDIAEYAAERLTKLDFTGSSAHYLLGERDLTLIEASGIIGSKISKSGLPYIMFPYDEAEKAMVAMGLSPDMSRTYVEMARAFNEGRIRVEKRTKENTTLTSIESFCEEVFVPAFTQKKVA